MLFSPAVSCLYFNSRSFHCPQTRLLLSARRTEERSTLNFTVRDQTFNLIKLNMTFIYLSFVFFWVWLMLQRSWSTGKPCTCWSLRIRSWLRRLKSGLSFCRTITPWCSVACTSTTPVKDRRRCVSLHAPLCRLPGSVWWAVSLSVVLQHMPSLSSSITRCQPQPKTQQSGELRSDWWEFNLVFITNLSVLPSKGRLTLTVWLQCDQKYLTVNNNCF